MQAETGGFQAQLIEAAERGYVAAFRWLSDREEARDACQEAVAKALKAQERYDPTQPLYPWFYRILKNHCLDRLRHRRRYLDAGEPVRAEREHPVPSAELALLETERERAVDRAIRRLPDDMREIIELRHFQDLSYQEMAEILGSPLGTVMSRLYRARRKLRDLLLDDPGFRGEPERRGR